MGCVDRWWRPVVAGCLRGCHDPGHQPDRRGFDIAFDAGDLPGKAERGPCLHAKLFIKQTRRIDECVAMQTAKARELRVFKPRNRLEDTHLLGIFQLRLESDHIVEGAKGVVLAKLDHGMRTAAVMGICQADRFHRPETQGLMAA